MRGTSSLVQHVVIVAVSALPLTLATEPALAIPSPELVVGSFVSLSQLFTLGSAVLGGGMAYAAMRGRRYGVQRASRYLVVGALVLFGLCVTSLALNIYQYVTHSNERQAQLEETLLRPSTTPGALPSDPEVKELSYGQQIKHPLGLSTDQAKALLDAAARRERKDLVFLDVRESAERAMGTLPGVQFTRYPDINAARVAEDFKGKQAILFCHNGNRSHEVCEALKKLGVDCRFMVGGLEKWVVEGRPIDGLETRNLEQLRAIPPYKNQNTLLDTNTVRRLVADEKAIFVDVRYPVEFKTHGRLPGSINLTIRRIPTTELPKHIAALPNRPIILPCYDRRGCFFAEVLGYELTKAGRDVRGRYTMPWAYFVEASRPPHVEQWIAENNRGTLAKLGDWLAGFLLSLAQWVGLPLAILALALASRLLVLPFSVKAERDQLRARASAGEFKALKARLADDPVRRSRAIRSFYKRNGITPLRNMTALAFLPIMAVALMAVQEASGVARSGFLWMSDLSQRDPLFILPALFAALITLYVDMAFATTMKQRAAIWLTVAPIMVVTATLFGGGVDLYLVTSAALLLVQRLWVAGAWRDVAAAWRRRGLPAGVIDLNDAAALSDRGNKAFRLAKMREAGMPVPYGMLLTPQVLSKFSQQDAAANKRDLDRIWARIGGIPLAVRSAAKNEDGDTNSFAGVFESELNVGRADLETAIAKVRASFSAARVGSYSSAAEDGSVLLQTMVPADYAGVLFTRDPSASGLTIVEVVKGTADGLVSGSVRPQTFRFGRVSKKAFGRSDAPIDLQPLLGLADRVEQLFGRPQDIEWAYHDGRFHLVQSRDVTAGASRDPEKAAAQASLAQAVDRAIGAGPDETVFAKNELSEMLPRPTPLSLSLMEALWASGGSVDLAARQLGVSYNAQEGKQLLVQVLGRLYVDKREERARAIAISGLTRRRLLRSGDRIEREFRDEFLPMYLDEARPQSVADFDKLETQELLREVAKIRDRFVFETHVAVDVVNIAAGFYLDRARRSLMRAGVEPSSVLGSIPQTIESHAIAEIAAAPSKRRPWLLMRHFGHRSVLDYELAEPRFGEDTALLNRTFTARETVAQARQDNVASYGNSVDRIVALARRFQTLKEDAKHHSLRDLAALRRAILAVDRRFEMKGNVFYLSFDELLTLNDDNVAALREVADERHAEAVRLRAADALPPTLTVHDLEAVSAGELSELHPMPEVIRGTRVSGSKVVEGRARVIAEDDAEHGAEIKDFKDGDIIVSAMINPAWLPYFSRAGGFVSEVGGWLSHPAILAREFDVAMVVGTDGIGRIEDGSAIRLSLDGRVEVIGSDRTAAAA